MTPFGKGATYNRISKADQGDTDGVTRQGEDTDEHAARRGIPVAAQHRYVDNDLSATQGKPRPAYGRLMGAVQRGEVDVIIVTYLSRLWRNRRERAEGVEFLRKHGVSVLCVKGPELDLTTATGRLLAGVMGEFDSFEVEQMVERQQREMQQRVERGEIPTGPRCFGYTAIGAEVIESEAKEVRDAFSALLAGATVSGIAADLNSRGIMNRNGQPWTHNAIRGMLLNERYASLRRYRDEIHAGTWPAIVEEDIWRKAVAILSDDSRRTTPGPARKWLLSGIALCGVCNDGTTVTSAYRGTKNGKRGTERIYRCRKTKHVARKAEPIDDLIACTAPDKPWGIVIELLSRPDAVTLLMDDKRPDAEELRTKATALRARLDALAAAFADDDESDAREFRTATKRIKERLAEVEAKMSHPERGPILAELITSGDVAATWEGLTLDRQRAVVDLLTTVTIYPAGPGRRAFDPRSVKVEPKRP